MDDLVCREGIVEAIGSDTIYVRIVQKSACSGCHAKGACTASDMSEKIVEVHQANKDFTVGERVLLEAESSMGSQAVVLAFVLPFVLVIGTLAFVSIFGNEIVAALSSIAVLIPYYGILYLRNDALKKRFSFKIKHKI